MNDKQTLRDDFEDRLAEQALGELLGGKRPPDLSERILAAAASQPIVVKRRSRMRLALAASLLVVVAFGGGYAGYQRLRNRSLAENGKRLVAAKGEAGRTEPTPAATPIKLEEVGSGMPAPKSEKTPRPNSKAQNDRGEQLAVLVDEFSNLINEHRYAEAEVIAKHAKQLAPDEPVAKQMALTAKMVRRVQDWEDVPDDVDNSAIPADNKQPYRFGPTQDWGRLTMTRRAPLQRRTKDRFSKKNFWVEPMSHNQYFVGEQYSETPIGSLETLAKKRRQAAREYGVFLGGMPNVDESSILYPDPDFWQLLAERSKKYKVARQAKVSLNEAEIIAALGDKTELDFIDQPLTDVVDYLQERHGIEIQVHEKVLTDSGVGMDEPITKNLKGVTLRSALRQMLGELNLTYVISDKALIITSQAEAEKLNPAKVYPVGDLIIPTPSPDDGRGPGEGGDRYSRIIENPFLGAAENPLSTFSIDVDTASYAKVRRYLLEESRLPPPDAVRIEELVNYFRYDLPQPEGEAPLTAKLEAAACPWQPKHRLLRVSLKAREIAAVARPAANLVFLLDVSGSMEPDDKLPRVRRAMRLLAEQLREQDRVAIVVYAGSSGLVLPSTSGFQKEKILSALESLAAGGSTNGGQGLALAYETAAASFIKGGANRVILCTDGDFNVGVTSDGELERLIEDKARSGVFLTVLGFGMGNHNDQLLEKLADKGNGNYGYIDTEDEARKLLVEQAGGTLVTVAKDVKLQLEFNPRQVAAYRLIGYEDRLLRPEDFNDDRKDAGEIGAGHAVTALYELIPAERPADAKDAAGDKVEANNVEVEPLKYQRPASLTDAAGSGELLSLKVKYKEPDAEQSKEALEFTVRDEGQGFGKASADFKFAAAVASFGMLLRGSEYKGDFTYDAVLEIAQEGIGADEQGYRKAFLEMVHKAKGLANAK